jgi:hypothetical protein
VKLPLRASPRSPFVTDRAYAGAKSSTMTNT